MLSLDAGQKLLLEKFFELEGSNGAPVRAAQKYVYDSLKFNLASELAEKDRLSKKLSGMGRLLRPYVSVETIRSLNAMIHELILDQFTAEEIKKAFQTYEKELQKEKQKEGEQLAGQKI